MLLTKRLYGILYRSLKLNIIVECDEYQHRSQNGSYKCEERRISELYDDIGSGQLYVIRWNPDYYKPINGTTNHLRKQRL